LWYSDTEGRGVLLGGFGGGVSWSKPLKDRWGLKAQLNVLRSRYYDEPVIFVDEIGQHLGAAIGITTNLNLTVLGIPKYSVAKWLNLGVGLGVHSTLLSKSDYGEALILGNKEDLKFTNKSLQPVVLTLPVEVTTHVGRRLSFSTRLEFSLTRISKIPYASNERFMLLFIEAGYRLSKEKTSKPVTNNR
jgi:hypothetical protein